MILSVSGRSDGCHLTILNTMPHSPTMTTVHTSPSLRGRVSAQVERWRVLRLGFSSPRRSGSTTFRWWRGSSWTMKRTSMLRGCGLSQSYGSECYQWIRSRRKLHSYSNLVARAKNPRWEAVLVPWTEGTSTWIQHYQGLHVGLAGQRPHIPYRAYLLSLFLYPYSLRS